MKKILAIILALVMLIPMGLVAGAEETAETKPFYAYTWSGMGNDNETMFSMVNLEFIDASGEVYLHCYGAKSSSTKKMAEYVKKIMDTRPVGARYIQILRNTRAYPIGAEDGIFLDKGAATVKKYVTNFLKTYKEMGGQLDGIIMDTEYFTVQNWYLYRDVYSKNPNIYQDITENPRYQTEIRPQLVERGFKFYENPTGNQSELWSIYPYSGAEYEVSRMIWDQLMRSRLSDYLNMSVWEPLQEYYPGTHMGDYQVTDFDGWQKKVSRIGSYIYLGGNTVKGGDTSNLNTYFAQPLNQFYNEGGEAIYRDIPAYYKAVYEKDSYNMFLWDMHRFKDAYLATDNGEVNFWISEYDGYNTDMANSQEGTSMSTPYYSEIFMHCGLMDPDMFLIFNPREERKDITDAEWQIRCDVIADCIKELNRVVGYADRKPIALPNNWNQGYVLSGMYANGRNIWRITPDTTDGMTVENFLVEGDDPTFSINGKTITFPGGKIIADGKVTELGTCGYWIETSADVMPVTYTDADRFEDYPSYSENYEQYKEGKLSYMDVRPETTWEIDTDNELTIVSKDGNKMLAISGSTTLTNVKMPQNITSGDYYAKQQVWEVTVNLPANMNSDAEVLLLGYEDADQIMGGAGFKIAGGKVYYDVDGEYEDLGVDVSGGGTYTFKRVVDFTDAEAFTSDFYVYNEKGKEVGKAKNAAMTVIDLPIYSIYISCEDLDEQILLDDYKLYPTGLTTDFELYNVSSGTMWADQEIAQEKDTAYRLSWMNASSEYADATVMAAVYEGDTLVSETELTTVTMAPGDDGVVIGTVEVAEGQSVKVYMKTSETDKNNIPGKPGASGSGDLSNLLPIIIIVLAVIVIGALLAIALCGGKKSKKKSKKKGSKKKGSKKKGSKKKGSKKKSSSTKAKVEAPAEEKAEAPAEAAEVAEVAEAVEAEEKAEAPAEVIEEAETPEVKEETETPDAE